MSRREDAVPAYERAIEDAQERELGEPEAANVSWLAREAEVEWEL